MTGGPFGLGALLVLIAASAAFTMLCPLVYRRDPRRRKRFLVLLAAALPLVPWWAAADLWTWPLGLSADVIDVLAQPVPWPAVVCWWSVGGLLVLRTLIRVRRGRRRLLLAAPFADPLVDAEGRDLTAPLALPAVARGWPETTRRAVLCHELAHLRRRDDRLMLLVRLLTDWYWWMPWVKSLHKRYVEPVERFRYKPRVVNGEAIPVTGVKHLVTFELG